MLCRPSLDDLNEFSGQEIRRGLSEHVEIPISSLVCSFNSHSLMIPNKNKMNDPVTTFSFLGGAPPSSHPPSAPTTIPPGDHLSPISRHSSAISRLYFPFLEGFRSMISVIGSAGLTQSGWLGRSRHGPLTRSSSQLLHPTHMMSNTHIHIEHVEM